MPHPAHWLEAFRNWCCCKIYWWGRLRMRRLSARCSGFQADIPPSAIGKAVFAKGYRVLICPTTTTTAIPAAFDPSKHLLRINGVRVDPYVSLMLTSIFNLLNWMPVINVPIGYSENGVPVGVQIAAR